MAEYKDRECYIPLRKSELVASLCSDKDLPQPERESFQHFCRLVESILHFEYHQRLEQLKDAFSSFDPDTDTKPLNPPSTGELDKKLDRLFNEFVSLMDRANFKRLSRAEIEKAMSEVSDWGLNMDVNFNVFERLEVFARGDVLGRRSRRRMTNFWRLEEVSLPVYQRLVLIMKLKPHKRLGADIATDKVFLKLFKDIPKMDIEMLLPGARMQMPGLQRLKLGGSFLSSVGYVAWKILDELKDLAVGIVQRNPLVFWGPLSLVAGYGYKQYYGYQSTKQSYSLLLTQSLYFQNLDNNAGVITRLLDEAEEQENREAMLAYYFLWRKAGDRGWTSRDLDDYIELELEGRAKVKVDFEIGDALAKLERLQCVEKVGDRYRARPIGQVLEQLDYIWDNYFKFNNAETAAATMTTR